jgi:hypothetical protein
VVHVAWADLVSCRSLESHSLEASAVGVCYV